MTVGEDSVQNRKRKKQTNKQSTNKQTNKQKKTLLLSSSHFVFYRKNYYNLMAFLSRLESLLLDVTSYTLNNCSFQNKESKI